MTYCLDLFTATTWRFVIFASALVATKPGVAFAQSSTTSENRFSVIVAGLAAIEPEGIHSGSPHVLEALGGTAPGFSASFTRDLGANFGIDFSLRVRGPITGENSVAVVESFSWSEVHREVGFDGTFVLGRTSKKAFHLEPLVGLSFVRGSTRRENIVARGFTAPARTLPDETFADHWFGPVFGLNAVATINGRMALVPSVRAYWLPSRKSPPNAHVNLANSVFDVGVGVQFRF